VLAETICEPWVDVEGLTGEAQEALAELRELTPRFFGPEFVQEKTSIAARIGARYFPLYGEVARRMCSQEDGLAARQETTSERDRWLVRCGAPDAAYLTDMLLDTLRPVVASRLQRRDEAKVLYADEWLAAAFRQEIAASATDEAAAPASRKADGAREQLQKAIDDHTAAKARLSQAVARGTDLDATAARTAATLQDLGVQRGKLYSAEKTITDATRGAGEAVLRRRKQLVSELRGALDGILGHENEVTEAFRRFDAMEKELQRLKRECVVEGAELAADAAAVNTELDTLRQMIKMSIGPKGNHFPVLSQGHLRGMADQMANTRESVIAQLAEYERMDPGVFTRTSLGESLRVEPLVVILPCAGTTGLCWQPWHSGNRRTPGRLAIPLFSAKPTNDLVLRALASLRWQVARETAMHYWMEEGLTGAYYALRPKAGSRLEEHFASDYVLWMTKEASGVATLDSRVRQILWRFCPFSDEVRDRLRQHGAYRQLFEQDDRRSKSRFTS